MGRPLRSDIFNPHEVCIAHVCQRAVRRAWLCGVDKVTGKDYSFRREWIRRRAEALASVFGIDVLTYAILSNHLHLILRNRPDVVATWSNEEVALRWLRVFPGRRMEEHLAEPTDSDVQALANDGKRIEVIRERLADISWFMRALSEPIARIANRQDEVTGRFWEGRFKAQRISDEAGLLACAMYVDLNPIRAAMAESIEQSVHTSAYDRLQGSKGYDMPSAAFDLVAIGSEEAGKQLRETPVAEHRRRRKEKKRNPTGKRVLRDGWLAPLEMSKSDSSLNPQAHRGRFRASDKGFLNVSWSDYLQLLRWLGKQKSGIEPMNVPSKLREILSKIGIDGSLFRDLVWNFGRYFRSSSCIGKPESMAAHAEQTGKTYHRNQRRATTFFAATS